MSTTLDDLDLPQQSKGGGPQGDERLANNILAQFASSSVSQPTPAAQYAPSYSPRILTEPPLTTSMGQVRMDPETARAHVIGSSIPSAADFQQMLQQRQPAGPAQMYASQVAWTPPPADVKNIPWKDALLQFLRGPVAVAILVFFLNLPIVTAILSRYVQWMYLSSGEISVGGLIVKSLLAAIMFATYQCVSMMLT